MTEVQARRERLMAKRVRALAVMHLTCRDDLVVEEVTEDIDLGLMVRIDRGQGAGLRPLGVALRGALGAVTREQADQLLSPAVAAVQRSGPFPFPVCLLFFTMEDSHGWYAWVTEPVVKSGGTELRACQEAASHPLDRTSLDRIVAAVDRWYDHLFAQAERKNGKGKGRRKSGQH